MSSYFIANINVLFLNSITIHKYFKLDKGKISLISSSFFDFVINIFPHLQHTSSSST